MIITVTKTRTYGKKKYTILYSPNACLRVPIAVM